MNNSNKKYSDQEQFFSNSLSKENVTGQLLVASRLYESMLEGVIITDTKGIIRFINPSFKRITGYSDEVIGQNPRILQSGKHDIIFYKNMWESIEQKGQWIGEIWNKRKDGSLLIQHTTITKIKNDFGHPMYYAAVLTDITERKELEQKLKDDLLLAKEVQKSALSQPIHNEDIHIEGVFLPSELVGGDMYAWYQINDHTYGILLMDVMGHGVASSLVTMSVRSLLRGIINKCVDPALVLNELNQHVYSLFREKESLGMKNYFLTCVYAVVDLKNSELTYASAGHPPIILIENDSNVLELDNGTVPLGLLEEINVQTASFSFQQKNTTMVFYTDGLVEKEQFGTRKNIDMLKQTISQNYNKPLQQMMNETIETQLNNLKTSKFQDDVTMVAARF